MPASYDTLDAVLKKARVRFLDAVQGITGEILTDNGWQTIEAINAGWQKMQEFLSAPPRKFQKFTNQTILESLAVVSTGDPATLTRLDWAGYFNGSATQATKVLPADFITPIELRERIHTPIVLSIGSGILSVVRASNVVTVTTNAAHNLTGGEQVTLAGVTDTTFNTVLVVLSVPTGSSFTAVQPGANGASAGGTVTSSISNFLEMDNLSEVGLPLAAKQAWNKRWEWRGDAIYLPGALSSIDLLLRYWSYAADFVPNSTTAFTAQTVPIMRCSDAFSNYICAEYAKARGDVDGQQFVDDGEAAALKLVQRESPEVQ